MAADPSYVLAYAGLADVYSLLGYYSYMEPNTAVIRAKQWVQEAGRWMHSASDDAKSAVLTSNAWLKMVFEGERYYQYLRQNFGTGESEFFVIFSRATSINNDV